MMNISHNRTWQLFSVLPIAQTHVPPDTARLNRKASFRRGLSFLELLAAVTILGILAMVVIPRFGDSGRKAKIQACASNKANIEVQTQLWYRRKGAWPANNLSDMGADRNFFPEGISTCPVDNSTYTIDGTTHRVVGHTH